jgi:hypothetical protein
MIMPSIIVLGNARYEVSPQYDPSPAEHTAICQTGSDGWLRRLWSIASSVMITSSNERLRHSHVSVPGPACTVVHEWVVAEDAAVGLR